VKGTAPYWRRVEAADFGIFAKSFRVSVMVPLSTQASYCATSVKVVDLTRV